MTARLRIAILWVQMAGYTHASFAALREAGAEVLLVHRAATADAPFDDVALDRGIDALRWDTAPPPDGELRAALDRFAPDVILVSSWNVGAYRRVTRSMRGRSLRVLFMDNQWLGTLKQWGGWALSRALIRPTYDAVFVPGERQAAFARRLGFPEDRTLWGAYTCNHPAFAPVARERSQLPKAFLFVGRLTPEKGVDVLADAYRQYRQGRTEPWPLIVCGTGPVAETVAAVPGVRLLGFVQPDGLPDVLRQAGCLVMPSRFEPWGVAIHEAVTAGMPVVCSSACGASTRLVLDGYNGAVVAPGKVDALAEALAWVSGPATDVALMGSRSAQLSDQFTPQRWASYFIERTGALKDAVR